MNQSFNVSGGGDNGNQCVGITGNAQNQIELVQCGPDLDGFEVEESGSNLRMDDTPTIECAQEVNEATAAIRGRLLLETNG